jgi:hypothetical protein
MLDIIFLENFSQDELSNYIDDLEITFEVKDLKFIEKFCHIKQLDMPLGKDIDNIESLNYLQNLESLSIWASSTIVNMPQFNLIKLKYLRLLAGNVNKISSIANFTNLEILTMNYNSNIEDMDTIFNLYNLKSLSIYGVTDLIDLTHIAKLQKLEFLDISYLTQDGINNLINLNQLKRLDSSLIDIVDISLLSNLPNLEIVILGNAHNYYDITPLAASKSLKEIGLTFGSKEEYTKYMNNVGKIFSENGINIPTDDWR